MSDTLKNLEEITKLAIEEIAKSDDLSLLEDLRVRYLGKKGELTLQLKNIGKLDASDRPKFGEKVNIAKNKLETALIAKKEHLELQSLATSLLEDVIDVSLPGRGQQIGGLHPVTRTMHRIEDIFTRMGFSVANGPEIEDDFHNFEALNIPDDHPARAMHDTFIWKMGIYCALIPLLCKCVICKSISRR